MGEYSQNQSEPSESDKSDPLRSPKDVPKTCYVDLPSQNNNNPPPRDLSSLEPPKLSPPEPPESSLPEYFGYLDSQLDAILSPDNHDGDESAHYFEYKQEDLDRILEGKMLQEAIKQDIEYERTHPQPHFDKEPRIWPNNPPEEDSKWSANESDDLTPIFSPALGLAKTQNSAMSESPSPQLQKAPTNSTPESLQEKTIPSSKKPTSATHSNDTLPNPPSTKTENNEAHTNSEHNTPQSTPPASNEAFEPSPPIKNHDTKRPPLSTQEILEVLGQPDFVYPDSWRARTKAEVNPPQKKVTTGHNYDGKPMQIPDFSVPFEEQRYVENYFRSHNPPNMTKDDQEMIKDGMIYVLYPPKSEKAYFGETKQTLKDRFQGHVSTGRRRVELNKLKAEGKIKESDIHPKYKTHLAHAMAKYGPSNFYCKKLQSVQNINKWTMHRLEGYYMMKYNTLNPEVGYNMRVGGSGGWNGPEQNEKIRQSNTGKKQSEETCKKKSISSKGRKAWNKGKSLTQEHKDNISASQIGREVSDSTRKLLSDLNNGENNPFYGRHHKEKSKREIGDTRKKNGVIITKEQLAKEHETKHHKFYEKHFSIKDTPDRDENITEKETEYRDLVHENLTQKEIAELMDIPDHAVRNMCTWIYGTRSLPKAREIERTHRQP